jgi:hypothetical protein
MPVPPFLTPLSPVPSPAAVPAALRVAPPGSGSLPGFAIEQQLQTNWCWAAVSVSVARFYEGQTAWSQCTVAGAELNRTDCCGGGAATSCNIPWYLDSVLTRVQHLRLMNAGTIPFGGVQTEINANRPLGCRIGWSTGGGHFVTIAGWMLASDGTEYVEVFDPFYAYNQTPYQSFVSTYQGIGTWTHSYFTQPRPAASVAGA